MFSCPQLGVPRHEELALGAIASGGVRVLNLHVIEMMRIDEQRIDAIAEREQKELMRRERAYRDGRPPVHIAGHIVILVDDDLATGASMFAATHAIRRFRPERLVVGVPISAPETCEYFRKKIDEIVCAETPEPFQAVGLWYEDFSQTTDDEVRDLLRRMAQHQLR